jgi:hypothetical protein
MKFRCPNNTPIRVASTSGHVAIVGPEFRELPESLHAEALTKGCICDQQIVQAVDPTADPYSKVAGANAVATGGERALIKAALKQMLLDRIENPHSPRDADDVDPRFTPDKLPQVEYVSKIAGIAVSKSDVLAVWKELQDEAQTVPTVKTGQEKAREAGAKAAKTKAGA